MKTEDQRITQYALGELHGAEREQFENELAQSEELQRELQETVTLCEQLHNLPAGDDGLMDEQRRSLREECLANVKVARRRIVRRKVVVRGALGALAACLLLAPMTPWFEVSRFVNQAAASASEGSSFVVVEDMANIEGRAAGAPAPVAMEAGKVLAPADMAISANVAPALAASVPVASLPEQVQPLNAPAPSGTPLSVAINEEKNKTLLAEGERFYEQGRFDLALKRYAQVLADDPNNNVARQEQEKVSVSRQKYVEAAYNEERSRKLYLADAGWNSSAKNFNVGASTLSSSPVISSGSVHGDQSMFLSASADHERAAVRRRLVDQNVGTESYASVPENIFARVSEQPLSTFSIDVDTASYANIRRFLQQDRLPPQDAVRIEELVNYFSYDYPQPREGRPFSVSIESAAAPWNSQHELVRIGLKGRDISKEGRGPANLVFLVDVSGSMESEKKLPLLKRSLEALVKNLAPEDRVAIVVYAGSSGLVLPSTSGKDRQRILDALSNLKAGGGTNGSEGIELAYRTARENFLKDGNNRVILCSDGDFNVGITNQSDLVTLIEKERRSGVFLSVLGFGDGNLKDSTMEKLADKGNGNYAYIDSFSEGRKVLVEQMNSTLFTIAKDVKIQVEFNPAQVAGYRLIGYENRMLAKEEFNDDKKDAGEIGAGHAVTALYEIVRVGQSVPGQPSVDPLKYQTPSPLATSAMAVTGAVSGDLLTVKLRYKVPDGDKSELIEQAIPAGEVKAFDQASSDFQFSAAVAAFGMKLRGSAYDGEISWEDIQKIARRNLGDDPGSYRAEFLTLVEKASRLNR